MNGKIKHFIKTLTSKQVEDHFCMPLWLWVRTIISPHVSFKIQNKVEGEVDEPCYYFLAAHVQNTIRKKL